ncbi:unnamed protein product [Rotaria magnacalcarata]|uniref:Ricin B lectin domain-containing protein n=1 Tax=Rotaria magnacalcarata TaxID=392030 RepID=A0A816VD81_9BILA|nr:unnamed protein product [Rotaria magnacalcarata]CAF4017346.1 unnamed protein product [Rotaria magnacalcarata]
MKGNNIAFFGRTSTGKSTMINRLVGEDVAATGAGETTLEPKKYTCTGFALWDMPGRNDDISYFSAKYIGFWKGLSRRTILIINTVKEMSHVCQLLDQLRRDYNIVVGKFDMVDAAEQDQFKKQIYDEIKTLGFTHARKDKCDPTLTLTTAVAHDGANVQIYSDNGTDAQHWTIYQNSDGSVKLINFNSGKALDVDSSGTDDGTNVQIYTDNGTDAQRWVPNPAGDGVYVLTNVICDMALDTRYSGTADGTNVHIWSPNGTAAQRW